MTGHYAVRVPIELAQLAGILVHQGIAQLLVEGNRSITAEDSSFRDRIWSLSDELVLGSPLHGSQRRRVRQQVGTAIASYWMRWLPGSHYQFVGAEVALQPGNRIDLMWRSPETGIFFDELKLGREPISLISVTALEQAKRYAIAGKERFGEEFLGVRLIPLGTPASAQLITPNAEVLPLAESPLWMVR